MEVNEVKKAEYLSNKIRCKLDNKKCIYFCTRNHILIRIKMCNAMQIYYLPLLPAMD